MKVIIRNRYKMDNYTAIHFNRGKNSRYLSQSMPSYELGPDFVECAFGDIGMAIFMWSTWQSNGHQ